MAVKIQSETVYQLQYHNIMQCNCSKTAIESIPVEVALLFIRTIQMVLSDFIKEVTSS